ncbi:MAG: transposase [Kiritimatiellia bacterium]|jgi:REP element-mobilizing transposase RayT|nr:transposase [Kiritimatiellia bacterium]MDP6810038.1 transposase [Kiritimatiellia bacterium]MDP7024809.1 transposase [Kiritimatiellia bacterium]
MSNGRKNAPIDLASMEQKIREWGKPKPIYTPRGVRKVHHLRYDWTGWLSGEAPFPSTAEDAICACREAWREDGMALAEFRVHNDRVQLLFDVQPEVSPVLCTTRAKGRLNNALRQAGTPVRFSRKVAFRSLGENIDRTVEGYLRKQVRKEGFVDPRYVAKMDAFTIEDESVALSEPAETERGRYWYGLHLVVVMAGRRRLVDYELMGKIRDTCLAIGRKKECGIRAVSVMQDHTHVALKGNIALSPEEIALSFLNNLAFGMGRNRVWKDEYYVGTFSEYGMESIRDLFERLGVKGSQPPTGKPVGGHRDLRTKR